MGSEPLVPLKRVSGRPAPAGGGGRPRADMLADSAHGCAGLGQLVEQCPMIGQNGAQRRPADRVSPD